VGSGSVWGKKAGSIPAGVAALGKDCRWPSRGDGFAVTDDVLVGAKNVEENLENRLERKGISLMYLIGQITSRLGKKKVVIFEQK
jgi:hypothetical protein